MNVIADTPRLRLRRIVAADAGAFFELGTDPQVLRYTGVTPMASPAEAGALVEELIARYSRDGFGRWAVERREDGVFLGWCGLRRIEGQGVDLGFWLLRRYWGQGYASEAARACVDLAFGAFALPFLLGRAVSGNRASCAVLERLGFMPWYRRAGWGYDDVRFSILRRPDARPVDASRDVICREGPLHARLLQTGDQLDLFMLLGNPDPLRFCDDAVLDFESAGQLLDLRRQDARSSDAPLRMFAAGDATRPFLGTVSLVQTGSDVGIRCQLLESLHGQGIGRPLCRLNLALARQELPGRQIVARIDLRNAPALRVAEGLGGRRLPDERGHAQVLWEPELAGA